MRQVGWAWEFRVHWFPQRAPLWGAARIPATPRALAALWRVWAMQEEGRARGTSCSRTWGFYSRPRLAMSCLRFSTMA